MYTWFLLLVMWFVAGFALGGVYREWRAYNRGRCRECGQVWELTGSDKYGRRGYECRQCHRQLWVVWPVDRKHGSGGAA